MKASIVRPMTSGSRLLFFVLCPLALLCLLGSAVFWMFSVEGKTQTVSVAPQASKNPGNANVVQANQTSAPKVSTPPPRKLSDHSLARQAFMQKRLRSDPAYAELLKRDLRRRTLRAYGDLFRTLNTSAENKEKLKEVLDRHADQTDELRSVLAEKGLDSNDPIYAKAFSNVNSERDAEVRSFFEKEGLEYSLFERATLSSDWMVSYSREFDAFLELQGCTRLGSDEALKLRNTIAEVRLATRGSGVGGQELLSKHTEIGQEVMRRMSATLTKAQTEALSQYYAMTIARNEAVRLVTRPNAAPGTVVYGSIWE